jgi:hypothetical protein
VARHCETDKVRGTLSGAFVGLVAGLLVAGGLLVDGLLVEVVAVPVCVPADDVALALAVGL